jgi:UPF0176 protein
MSVLHNRISSQELKQKLMEDTTPRTTLSFYQYFPIQNPQEFRDYLYKNLVGLKVLGRIYVAKEGINAQISVATAHFEEMKNFLQQIPYLENLRLNVAVDDDGKSFWVLKIKVRDKVVADGIDDPNFSMENKGGYVNAQQMNTLLNDEQTVVIDMRNHYEYEVGHFENAIEIPSDTFREQLPMAVEMMKGKEEKNIIMYCTGGIRCEKASAYMLHNGFKNVFHLEGGIINYAQQIKKENLPSKFIGKNFVFDNRLGERITEDIIANCHQCGNPCDTHVNCKNDGCHLLFIQCKECGEAFNHCCSIECKHTIHLPVERQKEIRKGVDNGNMVFNKSKSRLRPRLDEINKEKNL